MSDTAARQNYKSPITRAVVNLIEMAVEGKKEADCGDKKSKAPGMNIVVKIAWTSLKPHIPIMLYSLDNDPEALQSIRIAILKVIHEDLEKEGGPGYLAWVKEGPDEKPLIERLT